MRSQPRTHAFIEVVFVPLDHHFCMKEELELDQTDTPICPFMAYDIYSNGLYAPIPVRNGV